MGSYYDDAQGVAFDTSTSHRLPVDFGQLVAFAGERLTVAAVAVGPTTATYAPTDQVAAEAVDASVETADIRLYFDGRTPTASLGHLIVAGSSFRVEGATNVAQLKMIRATGTSAAVELSYERPG